MAEGSLSSAPGKGLKKKAGMSKAMVFVKGIGAPDYRLRFVISQVHKRVVGGGVLHNVLESISGLLL